MNHGPATWSSIFSNLMRFQDTKNGNDARCDKDALHLSLAGLNARCHFYILQRAGKARGTY